MGWGLYRCLLMGFVVSMLCSCSTQLRYSEVKPGQILGRPAVVWETPDRFLLKRDTQRPFRFLRHNGDVIEPQNLHTDGGSVPRMLWGYEGFSPWQFAPAYLIHDWLYESHRRGLKPGTRASGFKRADGSSRPLDREEADEIMAEVIKTQMRDPNLKTTESPWHLEKIHWAVRRYGLAAWNGEPEPVDDEESGPRLKPGRLLPLHWLEPLGMELQSKLLRGERLDHSGPSGHFIPDVGQDSVVNLVDDVVCHGSPVPLRPHVMPIPSGALQQHV
jgi:hypothetical protein